MKKGLTLDSKAEKILFLTQLHFSMVYFNADSSLNVFSIDPLGI